MGALEDFMAGIRQVESGGNYAEPPNRVGASGAYQFIDSTWGNYGGYAHAYQAPPEVQDAKAAELMQGYYDQFGSWDAVAAAWIGGPGTAAKGPDAWAHISDGNISVQEYVRRVTSAMGDAETSGAGVGAAAGAASQQTVQDIAAPQKASQAALLLGAVGAAGGQQYASFVSPQGDSLGDRLQSILSVLKQGPMTHV